jgi:hypothetical protein
MKGVFYLSLFLLSFNIGFSQDGLTIFGYPEKRSFALVTNNTTARLVFDPNDAEVVETATDMFSNDLKMISGKRPLVGHDYKTGPAVIIGTLGESKFIQKLINTNKLDVSDIKKKWETFKISVIKKPFPDVEEVLVIVGSDPRGTAFGVLELSKLIGINPFTWWADVPVKKQSELYVSGNYISKQPSVKFRGIFLNDEDWGLQPWAEHTFEPEVGDIGPKTYSKIFELLLRLKANTIWPAMHPSTKAFFHYSGNPEMAKKYEIVVGTSHAEPMLRNNVDEWDEDHMGSFNYLTNQKRVYQYWEERVKEAKDLDVIFTLGMRGIHDSGMEGVKGIAEATANLQNILQDQRELLAAYSKKSIKKVPQAFTVYKEVLDIYDHGLELPEDVTIVWTDDNYGYIRRLSNEEERARKGGAGVYYHASYWGRPHDYQWLSTTHPGLIREEMLKAYKTNSRELWILNVGDLKPAEYNMQLFLDMAYDINNFQDPNYVDKHMQTFYSNAFGDKYGKSIAAIKQEYYNLAFERKPEFMGWSQTEPTTQIDTTAYDAFSWGDEVKTRIKEYDELGENVEQLLKEIPNTSRDAFFQLVYYPVKGASFINKKFLYRDLAIKYSKQNRLSAKDYKDLSHQYYDSIAALTEKYNTVIADGKWNEMIDMAPRGLPVFEKPEITLKLDPNPSLAAGISIENASGENALRLPTFYENSPEKHFFDIYLKKPATMKWSLQKVPSWLQINQTKGNLSDDGIAENRITVKVNWQKWRKANRPKDAELDLKLGELKYKIDLQLKSYDLAETSETIFTEQNGIVAMYAENYSGKSERGRFKWQMVPGLGYSNNLMQARPFSEKPLDTLQLEKSSPYLKYSIYTESLTDDAELILGALPTHPITSVHGVRIGVQWNDEPVRIVDFRTYGRSEEWKQNVLKNIALKSMPVEIFRAGKQTLKIYMIDQGVALDYIYLNLKDVELPYGLVPETRIKKIN